MKTDVFNRFFCFLIISFVIQHGAYAQEASKDEQKKTEIRNLVQSKNYVFVAQTVLPQSGRSINLTSYYDLKVKGDTLASDLPYFGRAYVAPIDPQEGGIRFTSGNFSYNEKDRKKGGWNILLTPKDAIDVREMSLTISENGYASLQVISNNRQTIGFNGYVKAAKQIK